MIYLDNHATTRCDPRVVAAMLPFFGEAFGNPGSLHADGEGAREAVESDRASIAASIGADPEEIVFTSGATESNNLAIRGVMERPRRRGDRVVSVTTEHRAVLEPLDRLARRGCRLTLLPVEPDGSPRAGLLDPQQLADALTTDTALVSVMLANNEVGVVQPIAEIAAACRAAGALLHCDATQAVGKIPVDVRALGIDLMSFTAHKAYGPKGVGALFVRRRDPIVRLDPLLVGGGQERGRRSGTLNTPGIVGFAEALRLCGADGQAERDRLRGLRDGMFHALAERIDGLRLLGPALDATDPAGAPLRLGHNLNVLVPGVDGQALMLRTPELALSSGAACSATDPAPSHVLRGLGLSEDDARCSLRIGLGRFNTAEEVATAADLIARGVAELRGLGVG